MIRSDYFLYPITHIKEPNGMYLVEWLLIFYLLTLIETKLASNIKVKITVQIKT